MLHSVIVSETFHVTEDTEKRAHFGICSDRKKRDRFLQSQIVSGCIGIVQTINSQQPTANSQQPTVNSQQSTVNSQHHLTVQPELISNLKSQID
jgi:hypothetical protein